MGTLAYLYGNDNLGRLAQFSGVGVTKRIRIFQKIL